VKSAFLGKLALAAIFGAAGIMKLGDTKGFAYDLHLFDLTPWPLSKALAFYLPSLEIIAAVALFVPRLRLGALFAVFGMSAVFSGAIASVWIRGLDISCGCFGQSHISSNYPLHLLGTILMIAATGCLILSESHASSKTFEKF
jgi:putative oxidoreductase